MLIITSLGLLAAFPRSSYSYYEVEDSSCLEIAYVTLRLRGLIAALDSA